MAVEASIVSGFRYCEDILTRGEEANLLACIAANDGHWEPDYARRAQRYGYRYNYDTNTVARLKPLPDWLVKWAARFCDFGWMHALADQATVQEYEPGVGISDHIDDPLCFGPEIVTVSLLSPCVYRLTNPKTKFFVEQVIQPRSAVILSDQVRAHWKHGIPARKTDIVDGQRRRRTKRLSITFRTANPARVES